MKEFRCMRCGHVWIARTTRKPRQCPGCWSNYLRVLTQESIPVVEFPSSMKLEYYLCEEFKKAFPEEYSLVQIKLLECGEFVPWEKLWVELTKLNFRMEFRISR